MNTITITYKNSSNKTITGQFGVAKASEISKDEKYALVEAGYEFIGKSEWRDEECAEVEKMAAQAAGVEVGEAVWVKAL